MTIGLSPLVSLSLELDSTGFAVFSAAEDKIRPRAAF
jgi:hypothetical protein